MEEEKANKIDKEKYDIEKVIKWECPTDTGIPLITMPNIPKPLHGLPPRKVMGQRAWDQKRKLCYFKADYKCEVCGAEPAKGNLHAHELYSIDYLEGESKFERCIAICKEDHDFIHSGRLVTLYKEGNIFYHKDYLLRVVEKGFKLISEYNKEHPEQEPLRAFYTFIDYLRVPELKDEMDVLIEKYDIKFYKPPRHGAKWNKWHLLYNNKKYFTEYKTPEDWGKAMEKAAKNDYVRQVKNPFSGGVYDEFNSLE